MKQAFKYYSETLLMHHWMIYSRKGLEIESAKSLYLKSKKFRLKESKKFRLGEKVKSSLAMTSSISAAGQQKLFAADCTEN